MTSPIALMTSLKHAGNERVKRTTPERVKRITWAFKIAALGKNGKPTSLSLAALLGFHRLAKPITLPVHLEDVTAMRQPVQQRRSHPLPLEHLVPVAQRRVAGQQQAG